MTRTFWIVTLVFIAVVLGWAIYWTRNAKKDELTKAPVNPSEENRAVATAVEFLTPPLDNWSGRVTKKPFGIKVSPTNSPVSPERFSGYHTGVDFEIFPGEENKDVTIRAVCGGILRLKEYAAGYGGLAVEQCVLNGGTVTVIYGHLRLSRIKEKVGDRVDAGAMIGVLGKGFSPETDGERKHLHLGIHHGRAIDLRGYVQDPQELAGWLDITKYLR